MRHQSSFIAQLANCNHLDCLRNSLFWKNLLLLSDPYKKKCSFNAVTNKYVSNVLIIMTYNISVTENVCLEERTFILKNLFNFKKINNLQSNFEKKIAYSASLARQ